MPMMMRTAVVATIPVMGAVRNAVIISYGGQLIRFPTAGSYAVGLSANAINTTIDVVRFQEVAQDVSSDINAIRKDVFDR